MHANDLPSARGSRSRIRTRDEELEEGGKGGEREDGKREAAGGLQITGCIVLPFDPPVTSTPIDRARVYTAVIARAAEKGAYYPAESEAY